MELKNSPRSYIQLEYSLGRITNIELHTPTNAAGMPNENQVPEQLLGYERLRVGESLPKLSVSLECANPALRH